MSEQSVPQAPLPNTIWRSTKDAGRALVRKIVAVTDTRVCYRRLRKDGTLGVRIAAHHDDWETWVKDAQAVMDELRLAPAFPAEKGVTFFARTDTGEWFTVNEDEVWAKCAPLT